jgi:hypothetical protein
MLGRPCTAAGVEGVMVDLPSDDSVHITGGLFTFYIGGIAC